MSLNVSALVATLPCTWSVLGLLGLVSVNWEMARLICSFYPSVEARQIVRDTLCILLGHQASKRASKYPTILFSHQGAGGRENIPMPTVSQHHQQMEAATPKLQPVRQLPQTEQTRGRYHGGLRPSSDDSLQSPTVIPPSALDKPAIIKCYHRRRTCIRTSPRRSPTMVTLDGPRAGYSVQDENWAQQT